MTWVRIDDAAPSHPKLTEAGPEAAWLWVCGLAFCNRHTTDGRVPKASVRVLYPGHDWTKKRLEALASRLVSVGLWIDSGSDYVVAGYEKYQKQAMSTEVARSREYDKSRKAEEREAAKAKAFRECPDRTGLGDAKHVQSDARVVSSTPGPTRPDPSRPSHSASERADAGATPASARTKPRSQEVRELVRERYRAAGQTLPRQATDLTGIEGTRFREWAEQVDDLTTLGAQLDAFLRARPIRPFGWFMTNPAEALSAAPMHDTPEMRAAAVAALAKVPTIKVPKGSEDEPLPADFMEGVTWR